VTSVKLKGLRSSICRVDASAKSSGILLGDGRAAVERFN